MSNYGPPGGPYPGQPPYGQPADPWGESDPWGGGQPSGPPGGQSTPPGQAHGGQPGYPGYDQTYGQGGYGYNQQQGYPPPGFQQPGYDYQQWTQPTPPPKRGSTGLIVTIVVVLALLVGAGIFVSLNLFNDAKNNAGGVTPSGSASPSLASPTAGATTPGPEASTDGRFAKKGECIVNEGTNTAPKIRIVACAAGTYEVLARVDGATNGEEDAKAKCKDVPSYQFHYYFNSELDVLDFVLCLKRR